MATKKRLAESRKYATGAVHEVASGKFVVLDRYLDDDGITMLKIEWLSGDRKGEIEENKEQNINASIHKFNLANDKPKWSGEPDIPFMELISETNSIVLACYERIKSCEEQLASFTSMVFERDNTIKLLNEQIVRLTEHHALLNKQQDSINKQQDTISKLIDTVNERSKI